MTFFGSLVEGDVLSRAAADHALLTRVQYYRGADPETLLTLVPEPHRSRVELSPDVPTALDAAHQQAEAPAAGIGHRAGHRDFATVERQAIRHAVQRLADGAEHHIGVDHPGFAGFLQIAI